jgi:hypothetical protein
MLRIIRKIKARAPKHRPISALRPKRDVVAVSTCINLLKIACLK